MKERVITGVKPTGTLHIGNFFGAIKPTLDLAQNYETLVFIADYHALNYIKTKNELKDLSFELACAYLACGLDPNKVIFFKQSDVAEVFELASVLNNVTPKGLMNRAHAYKAMVDENIANGEDKDFGVNMGLFNYPILMASDILLYQTKYVPVGQDQKQHCEIARDIAIAFNNRYGNTFVVPEAKISEEIATIIGLDGRKMSKSYGNTIQLFAEENILKKSINRIVTDSKLPGEPKDPNCSLAKIYNLFSNEKQQEEYKNELIAGMSYGDAKKKLFELANEYLTPMREKYNYYKNHKQEVIQILENGAKKAKEIAKETIALVRENIGINF